MKKAELVFIPTPAMGHLASTVEFAKLLVTTNHHLFVTVLLTKVPFDSKVGAYIDSLSASSSISQRINFIILPNRKDTNNTDPNPLVFITSFMEDQKPHVRNHIHCSNEAAGSDSPRLAGFVVDMFSTAMIDVANELGVPSYVFFTSGAGFLGLLFQLLSLHDEENIDTTLLCKKDSNTELIFSSFENPVPASVLPDIIFMDKISAAITMNHARKIRGTKGVMVNTFVELESHAIHSLLFDGNFNFPPLYPIGPIISLKSNKFSDVGYSGPDITEWLDDQPPSSVLFLCFGSTGSFSKNQVKEISTALQNSGIRFLWSLRQPPLKENKAFLPSDYDDPKQVLSPEFLDRTAGIGKIIGWAPQVDILAHPAIRGFVSHCGWNSILESIWFGVPIAAWPVEAEQQLNAFQLVKELGLAVEIKLDHRNNTSFYDYEYDQNEASGIVSAQEIELGIKRLMGFDNEAKNKVKLMSEKSKKALMDGGSSHSSLNNLINAVMDNLP